MKIAIVGLGQIGGSFALALSPMTQIIGIDVSGKRRRLMQPMLRSVSSDFRDAFDADLIFLCLHFDETMKFLKLPGIRTKLIVDVCSGKTKIVKEAERLKLKFIGGHPLTGNEKPLEQGWDATIFRQTPFFLSPTRYSNAADLERVKRIVRKSGARPILVDPKLHDRMMARTSHFPAFLSLMLSKMCRDVPDIFQGPGYRSMTRLSRTSPELLATFLESNRTEIMKCVRQMHHALEEFYSTQKRNGAK